MKRSNNYFSRVLCALVLCAGLVVTGCYDDTALQTQLKDLDSRVEELERLTAQQNTNLESLQTIVNALQERDYVTNVAPIKEGDDVIGYTITFSKSGAVTIYNGEDGYVPAMGVKQDESDGQWYWTVDGEWMTDSEGKKVRASATDGEDGEDGNQGETGVTPQLKIIDGYWYVSYDGGKTWEEETLGQATGDKGYTMFAEVSYDDDYLYITMSDGQKLTLPRASSSQGEGGEGEGDVEQVGPVAMELSEITASTVTFTGHLNVAASDLSFSQVIIYYSDSEPFNVNTAQKVSTTTFDEQQNFTITLHGLKYGTKYNYSLVAEVKSEKDYSDVAAFTTAGVVPSVSVVESSVTATTASFSGTVTGLSEIDKSSIQVGMAYSSVSDDLHSYKSTKVASGEISEDGTYSMSVKQYTYDAIKYYYCSYVLQNGVYTYGEVKEFSTKGAVADLNMSSATDLSSSESANCYIISQSGTYKFKTVKGNSTTSVGNVASCTILWESFGTSTTPELFNLISGVCYKDNYIAFQTSSTFTEGNAVIAAKDASGKILWSWHIWLTDKPAEHIYNNNAGTMMDRNLGATSATPGDVCALGLLYQWGRKDPFLGSSSISEMTNATSTITWPSAVGSTSETGTIDYVTANPTTYVYCASSSNDHDWHYGSRDNTLWQSEKTIYDPCPPGWRVPDGGSSGVWSTALGSSLSFKNEELYDSTNKGINFSGKFGTASTIWYPASGYRDDRDGGLDYVGSLGLDWSVTPISNYAYSLYFSYDGFVNPSSSSSRAYGCAVRCLQE